jgi:hypothetical protein
MMILPGVLQVPAAQDVVVCSLGSQAFIKEKLAVTKELWAAGVSATILYETNQVCKDHSLALLCPSSSESLLKLIFVVGLSVKLFLPIFDICFLVWNETSTQ